MTFRFPSMPRIMTEAKIDLIKVRNYSLDSFSVEIPRSELWMEV